MRPALALTLALTRCGAAPTHTYVTEHISTPDVEALVAEFELAYGHRISVPVQLVPQTDIDARATGPNTVALCAAGAEGARVSLSADYWTVASDAARWALVFHELGHCVLGRGHLDLTEPDGCPTSIMYPSVTPTAACLQAGVRTTIDYAQELFAAP